MSDAVSELDAFLKNMSKLKLESVQMPPPPGLPFPNTSHFNQMSILPDLPQKPITEQDLLSIYPHSSQQSSLLSQLPLPNTDFDFDLNKNSLLEDEFHKLTFNTSYQSGNEKNYSSMDHSRTSHNISLNESQQDSVIFSSNKYYMPGTASLIEDVDKQLMVVLRDGKTLIGFLRSIDQYANLLLSNTIERVHVGNKYGDIPRGVYIVRGENVVLIGEIDLNKECKIGMINVGVDEILELKRNEEIKEQEIEKNKKKAMMSRCILPQTDSILDDYY